MNHPYLLQHISYHLHTITRYYTYSHEQIAQFCARVDFDDSSVLPSILEYCSSLGSDKSVPHILSVNDCFVYGIVPCQEHYFVIGPVRFTQNVFSIHRIDCGTTDPLWLNTIPLCEIDDLVTDLLLIYNLHHVSVLDADRLLQFNCIPQDIDATIQKHYSALMFENIEYQKTHNPYDQEFREQSSIENGDLEGLEKSWKEDYTGELGTLSKDSLRNWKNLAIVVITLASRSAIRGGLLPEEAFSVSDIYIQKVEDCHDLSTVTHVMRSCEVYYTRLVKELKEKQNGAKREKNPHINKCKDYIFKHLHDKITVQEIADALCINANYLSELFHTCEGVTISRFILNEKIKLAKNLLTYSRYSYIEIAAYLGFTSQSYLGQQFKKLTGYTLKQYRDAYGLKEFQ